VVEAGGTGEGAGCAAGTCAKAAEPQKKPTPMANNRTLARPKATRPMPPQHRQSRCIVKLAVV
jgi:hypothetical protein